MVYCHTSSTLTAVFDANGTTLGFLNSFPIEPQPLLDLWDHNFWNSSSTFDSVVFKSELSVSANSPCTWVASPEEKEQTTTPSSLPSHGSPVSPAPEDKYTSSFQLAPLTGESPPSAAWRMSDVSHSFASANKLPVFKFYDSHYFCTETPPPESPSTKSIP
jgi:hypothetical protein